FAWAQVIGQVAKFCTTKEHRRLDFASFGHHAAQIGITIDDDTTARAIESLYRISAAKGKSYMPMKGATIAELLGVTKAERAAYGLAQSTPVDEDEHEATQRRKQTEPERGRTRRKPQGCRTKEAYAAFLSKRRDELAPTILDLKGQCLSL